MTETPRAVIFDIGNVLITWNPERLYRELMGEEKMQHFFATVDPHEMNELVDQGHPFRETIYAHAEKHPEYRDEIRLWHDRWIEMASPTIDDSVAMLRSLRASGVPCHALSNFGIESFAYALTHYPFLDEFDTRFISGHLKVTKPSARIYEIVEEETALTGAELFFTDDRADNIDAAVARGWQTHLFEGPAGLREALKSRGLPV
ncbi:HAD family hydrolase [Pontivivens ytuae]|uniref:HAD family phosphatase n=1 Tax=Pontivivens ytuae TaxID=2789856 RepID=A0A7S9LVB5_9RHOB|nr:HAD family phosphatase [Pontivivens ytuae]QPH55919.1 HAD family phosphatase [Pontivivens ytuae]